MSVENLSFNTKISNGKKPEEEGNTHGCSTSVVAFSFYFFPDFIEKMKTDEWVFFLLDSHLIKVRESTSFERRKP